MDIMLEALVLDSYLYSLHSLRRGGASAVYRSSAIGHKVPWAVGK